jgi:hypothetical protein
MIGSVDLNVFRKEIARPGAFAGGTTNARGDDGGTNDPFTLFTVTGDVLVRMFGVCTVNLAGAGATVEVGVTGNTAALIAQTTGTDIDANDIFNDASPAVGTDTLANITGPHVIVNGLDIIETVATANVTSGNIYYVCLWQPLSEDGDVVAAGNAGF